MKEASDALEKKRVAELALIEAKKGLSYVLGLSYVFVVCIWCCIPTLDTVYWTLSTVQRPVSCAQCPPITNLHDSRSTNHNNLNAVFESNKRWRKRERERKQ